MGLRNAAAADPRRVIEKPDRAGFPHPSGYPQNRFRSPEVGSPAPMLSLDVDRTQEEHMIPVILAVKLGTAAIAGVTVTGPATESAKASARDTAVPSLCGPPGLPTGPESGAWSPEGSTGRSPYGARGQRPEETDGRRGGDIRTENTWAAGAGIAGAVDMRTAMPIRRSTGDGSLVGGWPPIEANGEALIRWIERWMAHMELWIRQAQHATAPPAGATTTIGEQRAVGEGVTSAVVPPKGRAAVGMRSAALALARKWPVARDERLEALPVRSWLLWPSFGTASSDGGFTLGEAGALFGVAGLARFDQFENCLQDGGGIGLDDGVAGPEQGGKSELNASAWWPDARSSSVRVPDARDADDESHTTHAVGLLNLDLQISVPPGSRGQDVPDLSDRGLGGGSMRPGSTGVGEVRGEPAGEASGEPGAVAAETPGEATADGTAPSGGPTLKAGELGSKATGTQGEPAVETRGDVAVKAAESWLGTPYTWGGGAAGGPSKGVGRGAVRVGFDCSGLVMAAWAKAGVELGHYTGTQFRQGRRVALDELRPGDLMFFGGGQSDPTHVGMYAGDGLMIHAPKTGDVVKKVDVLGSRHYMTTFRGAVRPA
ncbi:C40 family peptidase [Microtetraspora fusca]|uniref:C40 family peptidase n=1 Tax=Microtetraspora fusca TaxID=1997 RepID=UPI0012FC74B8|nr:NlpC/P60 family protein [Microtetraspora fusca]